MNEHKVGIAAMDLKRPELLLSQFVENGTSYANLQSMLSVYEPIEVILPASISNSKIAEIASQHCAHNGVSGIARKFFNETNGSMLIKKLVVPEKSSIENEIAKKYLCISSASALLQYIEHIQKITFPAKSLCITYHPCHGHMLLDQSAITHLELVQNLKTGDEEDTLFSIVNHTTTTMGARMMRSQLLQPLTDMATITTRQDCIDQLLQNERAFFDLSSSLQGFPDLDTVLTRFVHVPKIVTANPKAVRTALNLACHMISLITALDRVPIISEALEPFTHTLFTSISDILLNPEIEILRDDIYRTVGAESINNGRTRATHLQAMYVVKEGVHNLLDKTRERFEETMEAIQSLVERYKSETGIDSMKLQRNARRGYFLSMDIDALEEENHLNRTLFVQKIVRGKRLTCSTDELSSLNTKLDTVSDEVLMIQEGVLQDVVDRIRARIGSLFLVGESIALLDVLFSFASLVASSADYTRPQFTEDGPIAIKQGRHPVLDRSTSSGFFIPNDTYLSGSSNLQIFSGANMSGKTTYLKQIGQLIILAHTGCYIPCKFASLPKIDRLFTRIGTEDSMESNAGSFLVEMKEMAYILQNVTKRSLVLIDELGRGTNNIEGCSFAWSVCEYLLSLGSYTIFTTHYSQMADLELLYPNVKNYHLVTSTENRSLNFEYRVGEGSCSEDRYGIKLARMLGLPEDIVDSAEQVCSRIEREKQIKLAKTIESCIDGGSGAENRKVIKLAHWLLSLKYSSLNPAILRTVVAQMWRQNADILIPRSTDVVHGSSPREEEEEGRGDEKDVDQISLDGVQQ